MRPSISQFTAFLYGTLAAGASTTTRVDVGLNGALAFSPDTIKASVGDVLEFHFHPINHSVVMSDFNNPCAPATTGGFFSGFMPVSSGEAADVFRVTVNSTDPIFFYCAQNILSHCKSGMSGVVNPSTDQTLAKYQAAAKSVSSATNPPRQFGGIIAANSAPSASPSTSAKPTNNGGGLYGTGNAGTTLSISPLIWLSLVSAAAVSFLL